MPDNFEERRRPEWQFQAKVVLADLAFFSIFFLENHPVSLFQCETTCGLLVLDNLKVANSTIGLLLSHVLQDLTQLLHRAAENH